MYRWIVALRWLFSRRINLLSASGTAVGVWALIVVVSVFSGYLTEVEKHLQSSTADLTISRLPFEADFEEVATIVEADPNVAACAPRVVWRSLVHPFGKDAGKPPPPTSIGEMGADTPFVSIIGIDPAREMAVTDLRSWLDAVEDPQQRVTSTDDPFGKIDGRPAIVLGRTRLQREQLARGTRTKVSTARQVQFGREAPELDFDEVDFALAGSFETSYALFDGLNAFASIHDLRAHRGQSRGFVSNVVVKLRDQADSVETAGRLRRALERELAPRYPIRVRTWADDNRSSLESYAHQRSLMKLVLLVIMVVASFLMYATLSEMVAEKRRDIGVLTALGATPLGIMTLFISSGLAVTIAGTIVGVLIGCFTAIQLDPFNTWLKANFGIDLFPVQIYNLTFVPYELDPAWIGQVVGAAIGLGFLVSGIPAWRAARQDPLTTLRHE